MARIAIACGGTGGHLYPGLAVAERLRSRGHDLKLYVSDKPIDRIVMESAPGYDHAVVPAIGWPGINLHAFRFCRQFLRAYRAAVDEVRGFRPDAVLGMGGFVCAPLLLSARRRGVPTLLHESNAIPGKVTRWLGPRSDRLLLGFDECASHLPGAEIRVTGTPVRTSLGRINRAEAARFWELDPTRFTLAVMGGSQGSRGLNHMAIRAASRWKHLADRLQIIHLAGSGEEDLIRMNYERNGLTVRVRAFCDRMETVYSLADFVIARSGAASLTELSHYGLPSILVPYPHAAEKHQHINAGVFTSRGAALMIEEKDGADSRLAEEVAAMLDDRPRLATMAERAADGDPAGAADRVAQEVEDVLF